ncbi:MAG TPA: fibronectin type III domain-containing protein [Pyrinomonadaceae bacterium]|nr:fibronectin type III domain-containing protein [Pyrinomonadaceae bacterium]
MSKKKTMRKHQERRWRSDLAKNRTLVVAGSSFLIVILGVAAVGGPWRASLSKTRVGSLFFSPPPPPLPSPNSPSKEYIYAGGRLIATEEPNPLAAPTNLVADTFSSSRIDLTWTAAPNAHHYQVERAPNLGGTFALLDSNVTTTSFTDNSVTSVNAYLYRVRAADAVGNLSAPGSIDVATAITFTDNPLTAGATVIKAQHITELRQAVDAVRAAANLAATTWTDSSLTNVQVKAVHVQELRTNLDQALTALGLPTSSYTDSSLAGVLIKKVHVDELRQRVE